MCQVGYLAVVLTIHHQPGSSKSEYSSAWDQLLRAHTAEVSQPDPDRKSTVEQTMMRGSALATVTPATPSFSSLASLQHPNQTGERSRTYGRLTSRGVHLSTRPPSSSTQTSQTMFGQGNHARTTTPAPRQGQNTQNTSRSVLQVAGAGGTGSADLTTPAFSFQIPDQPNYPVHRGAQTDHSFRPVPTGYRFGNRSFVGSTPPSTQAPPQISAAPPSM